MPKQTRAFHIVDLIRHASRSAGFLVAAAVLVAPAVAAQSLEQRITQQIDTPPFNHQLWGIALVDASGRLLYGRNEERPFIPASNTKLVVSAVASALLPPDWTVKTSLYADGPVVDGVLEGDLVLYGRGDPTFSRRCYSVDTTVAGSCDDNPLDGMAQLAGKLRAAGIRTVAGDIVGDGSYFGPELVHPAWEVYDLNWWYAAPVTALGFNDNSLDISWDPGRTPGAPAEISFIPDFGNVVMVNRTRTVESGGRTTIDFFRDPGTLTVRAVGNVPLDSDGRTEYLALPDPNHFAAAALRQVLADSGISVLGRTGSTTDSTRYDHLRRQPALAELESRPLKDWIFPVLNTSQNWFAEMLLKQLGRQFGEAGTWDEGLEVERRFLIDSVGIDSTQFSLSDGSGLSST
ncbi:MAG: D-alanyl-D-alanine carboxypeptidase/D-alanyl-D-alanine endopeptidase, partial [Gemmatimonadales bacterium]